MRGRSAQPPQTLPRPRGAYGVDAPYVPAVMGSAGVALLVLAAAAASFRATTTWIAPPILAGVALLLNCTSYLYTTRAGKFSVWAEVLDGIGLRGDEQLLDMGCGRGAVLAMAAQRLPRGRAVGLDLWKTRVGAWGLSSLGRIVRWKATRRPLEVDAGRHLGLVCGTGRLVAHESA